MKRDIEIAINMMTEPNVSPEQLSRAWTRYNFEYVLDNETRELKKKAEIIWSKLYKLHNMR